MKNPAPGFAQHPNYKIDITPISGTVTVVADGTTIATSTQAVLLEESKHRPVWYFPLADLDAKAVTRSQTSTHCPFKGDASYLNVVLGNGHVIEDAIWYYPDPFDECMAIASYASVYTNKVDLRIDDKPVAAEGPGRIN